MAGDMGPPPARTSFKRSADDEEEHSLNTSKRAKPSSSRTEAQASQSSTGGRPKRYTPDGREIPYITPRPNGSWRMITGEDIVYSPEERPTIAPPPKAKPSSQPAINQSFGQSTSSGKPRKRERIVVPPTLTSSLNPTSSMRTSESSTSMSSSSRPNQGASRSQPEPSRSHNPHPQQRTQQSSSNGSTTTSKIKLIESIGDIFTAPPNTLIIHACNTEGSWGAGIAKAFKEKYPSAFKVYRDHCQLHGAELVGKALLIPPQGDDDDENQHFVGCLYTSLSKGRKVDSPAKILNATGPAVRDLLRQVKEYNNNNSHSAGATSQVCESRMCKINSGLFNVKWEKTKEVIQGIEAEKEESRIQQIRVISRSVEN